MGLHVDWKNSIVESDLSPTSRELFPLPSHADYALDGSSMVNFSPVVDGVAGAVKPSALCGVGYTGGSLGDFTTALAEAHGATVSLIGRNANDPGRSLPLADIYLIDEERNHQATVASLEQVDAATRGHAAVVFLAGVGWPTAFRDAFPSAREGADLPETTNGRVSPFDPAITDYGIPAPAASALSEGGPGVGVRGAVHDFVESKDDSWTYFDLPAYGGLGVLWKPDESLAAVNETLSAFAGVVDAYRPFFAHLELNRVMLLMRLHHAGDTWRRQRDQIDRLTVRVSGATQNAAPGRRVRAEPRLERIVDQSVGVEGRSSEVRALRAVFPGRPETTNYLVNWSARNRYIYVEVPKTGCTTIKRMLQLGEVAGATEQLDPNVHDKGRSPVLSPLDDMRGFAEAFDTRAAFRFAFVRHPYTRILSCYLDKIVANKWERRRRLPTLGFGPNEEISFETFLEAVAKQKPEDMDIHWAPQTYLMGLPMVRYDFIGRFERFGEDLAKVAEHIGMVDHFEAVRSGRPHATGAADRLHEHFSPGAVDLVSKIYSNDFEYLAYGHSLDVLA